MTELHVVVPDTVRRPDRPSGGNTYDRQVVRGLRAEGWSVHEHAVSGPWPRPDPAARAGLERVIDAVPDRRLVLVDGLVASGSAEVLVPHGARLRLVVLVHMPFADAGACDERDGPGAAAAGEARVLSSAGAVVTTSEWTRRRLVELHGLDPGRIHVAQPGVDRAAVAPGTPTGGELLCVAAVTPGKGHDLLLEALAAVRDLPWRCVWAGSLSLEPGFVLELQARRHALGLDDRVLLDGPLSRTDLDRAYAAADLLVLPSRGETYGMVVTEALARGLPVVAASVGGVPEAMGAAPDGRRPGLLTQPGDASALARALRGWLTDAGLREGLRGAARARRETLHGWPVTTRRLSEALRRAAG